MSEEQKTHQASEEHKNEHKEKNTGMAIIAYIVFFLPLLTAQKDDPFVKYHVKQGLVLLIASLILSFVASILFLYPFMVLVRLAWIVFVVIGISNAMHSKKEPLPLIGKYADRFKF